jgi:hypothetical protein
MLLPRPHRAQAFGQQPAPAQSPYSAAGSGPARERAGTGPCAVSWAGLAIGAPTRRRRRLDSGLKSAGSAGSLNLKAARLPPGSTHPV